MNFSGRSSGAGAPWTASIIFGSVISRSNGIAESRGRSVSASRSEHAGAPVVVVHGSDPPR